MVKILEQAVFIDRDGTLIEEVNYLSSLSQVKIYPFSFDAVKILNALDYKVIIVSNQSGVGRGYFTEDFVKKTNRYIIDEFAKNGALIDDSFFCPHLPSDNCSCRKPKSLMFINAKKIYNIDLTKSFMIGDNITDSEAAKGVGAFPIHVLTGHGYDSPPIDVVVTSNIYTASLLIRNIFTN